MAKNEIVNGHISQCLGNFIKLTRNYGLKPCMFLVMIFVLGFLIFNCSCLFNIRDFRHHLFASHGVIVVFVQIKGRLLKCAEILPDIQAIDNFPKTECITWWKQNRLDPHPPNLYSMHPIITLFTPLYSWKLDQRLSR